MAVEAKYSAEKWPASTLRRANQSSEYPPLVLRSTVLIRVEPTKFTRVGRDPRREFRNE